MRATIMSMSWRLRAFLFVSGTFLSIAPLLHGEEKAAAAKDKILFDFQDEATIKDWLPFKLPELKTDQPAPKLQIVWQSKDSTRTSATPAKGLKITFDGGDWPAVSTTKLPVQGNWPYQTLKAELTVDRPSFAYFRVCQAKPSNEKDPRSACFERTIRLVPGRNEVSLSLIGPFGPYLRPERGDVTSFVIGMFQPEKGQTLLVANVHLSLDGPLPKEFGRWSSPHNLGGYSVPNAREYQRTGTFPNFKVLGADMEVVDVRDLGRRLKDKWTKPKPKTIEEVETEFKAEFQQIKRSHPKAVMVILREGDKSCDPANPDKVYTGWKILHINCHGPDGPNSVREKVSGGPVVEAFMRHRGVLIEVNLACLPKNAKILGARFAITRVTSDKLMPPEKPNLYVVEPCNRDWDEKVANCYFYASGKHWKAVSGTYFGEDPDFEPIFLAHGPAGGSTVTVLDFTEAMKYWLDGKHANHGFFLHGDAGDYMLMHTHRARNLKERPALLVIYEPGS